MGCVIRSMSCADDIKVTVHGVDSDSHKFSLTQFGVFNELDVPAIVSVEFDQEVRGLKLSPREARKLGQLLIDSAKD